MKLSIPVDEATHASIEIHGRGITGERGNLGNVRVSLVHVPGLMGSFARSGFQAEMFFECTGSGAPDIEDVVGSLISWVAPGLSTDHGLNHIIDVGEVTREFAPIEELDRFTCQDLPGEQGQRHVQSAPGPVCGENSQERRLESVKMGVTVSHELAHTFRRAIKGGGQIRRIGLGSRKVS